MQEHNKQQQNIVFNQSYDIMYEQNMFNVDL